MEIKVGRYIICSDSCNLWVEESYQSKGKEQRRKVAGYCSNINDLCKSFFDGRLRGSDAGSVGELLAQVEQIRRETLDLCGGYHNAKI